MSSPSTGTPDSRPGIPDTRPPGSAAAAPPPAAGPAFGKPAAPGQPPAGPGAQRAGAPPAGGTRPPSAPGTPPGSTQPAGPPHAAPGFDEQGRVKRGKISALWVGLIAAAILLILLIIFIAQNSAKAPIHYLGASGHLGIGLMLLIAAIGGVLLAAIPGTVRILQLRSALKKSTPLEQRAPASRKKSKK